MKEAKITLTEKEIELLKKACEDMANTVWLNKEDQKNARIYDELFGKFNNIEL